MKRWCWLTFSILSASVAHGQAGSSADADRLLAALDSNHMRTHLSVLAHDSMEGRAPDTPGGRKAAAYIASRFREWGLAPAGDSGTFFHHFDFSIVRNLSSSIQFEGDSLRYGIEQVGTTMGAAERVEVRGEAVFVGYGISASGWDDYRGRDLEGKVVIALAGLPRGANPGLFPSGAASRSYKTSQAARHGARATLVIHRPDLAGFGWGEISRSWSEGHVAADPSASVARLDQPSASFWLSAAAAERLLQRAGYALDQLVEMANAATRQPVGLPLQLDLAATIMVRPVHARNVAGMLKGSGPGADEVVVIGGHYDHLGLGPPVNGDSIYNGAEDNAGGTAQLLALAEAFAKSGVRLGRSFLFLAFDGEEIGLLGSEAYVRRPTVPLDRQVAMINLDAANLWGATRDIAALGLKESTLDGPFRRAAGAEGLAVPASQPDSIEAFYLRSDQLPFARAGVPATFVFVGWDFVGRTPEWASRMWSSYFEQRYHQPSDQMQDFFSMAGALQQARVVARMALEIADSPDRPRWMESSRFFKH
jgi:hypothetical protein